MGLNRAQFPTFLRLWRRKGGIAHLVLVSSAALLGSAGSLYLLSAAYLRDFRLPLSLGQECARVLVGKTGEEERVYLWCACSLIMRSPEWDALSAHLQGDRHLVGIVGFGLFFPGVPDQYRNVVTDEKDLAGPVHGVGDCYFYGSQHIYQSVAFEYARRYNQIIWPDLIETLPGPALGIAPTTEAGEAYYWCGEAGASQPKHGAHIQILRLSIASRFDLVEGNFISDVPPERGLVLRFPYSAIEGHVYRAGSEIRVSYHAKTISKDGAVTERRLNDPLLVKDGALRFAGHEFRPCRWIRPTDFYVTFCQFSYQDTYVWDEELGPNYDSRGGLTYRKPQEPPQPLFP